MSITVAMLMALQVQATCAPGNRQPTESELTSAARYFVRMGSERNFAEAASFVAPNAVADHGGGETSMLIDSINEAAEESDPSRAQILDTMSSGDTVVLKVEYSDTGPGIIFLEFSGGCISRMGLL